MLKYKTFLLIFLMLPILTIAQQIPKYTISGYVQEKGSKELLPGVSVYIPSIKNGTVTNSYGFYSITLPKDTLTVIFSYVGFKKKSFLINLINDIELTAELELFNELNEIVITDKRNSISDKPQMSNIDIPIKQLKEIPAIMGEKDVFKVIQLLPGVQKGSEGQTGIYVRGGGPDQNLIILDDAPVYNAQHLFGFFSVFNGDALKSVELTKGGFPARFGGRLSSVIEMQMKDGNKEKTTGEFSIGAIASRGVIEGPIKKGKSSFLISARRTYFDILTQPIILLASEGTTRSGYYFYDFNAKCNFILTPKDRLFISGYFGKDNMYLRYKEKYYDDNKYISLEEKFNFYWGNKTATARWAHQLSKKLYLNTSAIFSNFTFGIDLNSKYDNQKFALKYYSGISDLSLKSTIDFIPNTIHSIKSGILVTRHLFTPSAIAIKDSEFPESNYDNKKRLETIETGIFTEDIIKIGEKIQVNTGLRISSFSVLKPSKSYINIEPRFSGNYVITPGFSSKLSWATMNQYLHLLSNTGIGLPTDLWVPVTDKVKPQRSHQVAAGFAKDFYEKGFSASIEGYYKLLENIITYKDGASFITVADDIESEDAKSIDWQNNVTQGNGKSYGTEFLLQKKEGKFTGWIGYTLSWTKVKFDEINFGKEFFPRHDRRHDASIVGIYELKKNITISATWVYGTGNAISLPQSEFIGIHHNPGQSGISSLKNYYINSLIVTEYGGKNSSRMAPYHRADISVMFKKQKKKGERTIELSVYNLYNRANPFFYYIGTSGYKGILGGDWGNSDSLRQLKQVSIFRLIPSLSYSFKFKN